MKIANNSAFHFREVVPTSFHAFVLRVYMCMYGRKYIYRVSQEECAKLREDVPYAKVYRYNTKTPMY